jgi:integrase/recombinase XerD
VFDDVERDIASVVMPRWGRVEASGGLVPWLVVGPDGVAVEPVRRFLADFVARGKSPGSVRSYAFGLLRWWRWLTAVGVEWDKATPAEARDLALWLCQAAKPGRGARAGSAATAGRVNPVTRKRHLGDGYEPRTIRHSNAVVRSFYEFWIEDMAAGPLVNPVQLDRRGRRPNAHRSPLEPFRAEGRLRYNPKVPRRGPREMPEERWRDLFAGLRSNRDRAILSLAVGNGARAGDLLGIRAADVDWGDQLVRVYRKGTGAAQWLPASPDAFTWLRLYLADLGVPLEADDLVWQTLRRRDRGGGLRRQPLGYEALRAVLRRANALLGSNWSMHDLRHTAALRMARDEALSLRDVQVILGHAHLSTTADVYLVEEEGEVIRRVAGHLAGQGGRGAAPAPEPAAGGYQAADLAVLLGGLAR